MKCAMNKLCGGCGDAAKKEERKHWAWDSFRKMNDKKWYMNNLTCWREYSSHFSTEIKETTHQINYGRWLDDPTVRHNQNRPPGLCYSQLVTVWSFLLVQGAFYKTQSKASSKKPFVLFFSFLLTKTCCPVLISIHTVARHCLQASKKPTVYKVDNPPEPDGACPGTGLKQISLRYVWVRLGPAFNVNVVWR